MWPQETMFLLSPCHSHCSALIGVHTASCLDHISLRSTSPPPSSVLYHFHATARFRVLSAAWITTLCPDKTFTGCPMTEVQSPYSGIQEPPCYGSKPSYPHVCFTLTETPLSSSPRCTQRLIKDVLKSTECIVTSIFL